MRDFGLLAWLRWRQWRSRALYWLRTLGYDPRRQGFWDRLYALYLIVIGLAWIIAVGIGAVHQAAETGRALPPSLTQAFLTILPWICIAAAIYLLIRGLRASPVMLSFPDMAFVAASPLSRAAVVLVNFIEACIQHWVVVLPLFALGTVVIAQPLGQPLARTAALRAAAVAAPLVPLLLALAWALGLLRLRDRERWGSGAWWMAALLLAPLAWLIPLLRWPGIAVGTAMAGGPVLPPVILLSALALCAIAGMARLAKGTNLIAAAEESRTYARLNALGLMTILTPDVALRIRRQEALARRRPRSHLSGSSGLQALAARSVLLSQRRAFALFRIFLWGVAAASTAAWLVLGHPPLILWFFWVTFLALAPPKMLVEAFESDVAHPYLRQLLPMSNGPLALADGVVPTAVLLLGAWTGCAFGAARFGLSPVAWVLAAWLAAAVVAILLCAQAAAAARVSIFGWGPPYAVWLIIAVILVGVAAVVFGPVGGTMIGATIAVFVLWAAVAGSRPIALD